MVGRDLAEWGDRWTTDEGFAAYVAGVVRDRDEDAPRRPGWVPCTTLWWVDGPAYLGRIAIRHRLTPTLGRSVDTSATTSAAPPDGRATRPRCSPPPCRWPPLGIDPALVTCDGTNVASRKVIEANGGVLEDQRGVKLRYWVPTGR